MWWTGQFIWLNELYTHKCDKHLQNKPSLIKMAQTAIAYFFKVKVGKAVLFQPNLISKWPEVEKEWASVPSVQNKQTDCVSSNEWASIASRQVSRQGISDTIIILSSILYSQLSGLPQQEWAG